MKRKCGALGPVLTSPPSLVQVKNGSVYAGIFSAASTSTKDLDIVLSFARLKEGDTASNTAASQGAVKTLKFLYSDLVQVLAKDVPLGADDLGPTGLKDSDAFSTDSEISRKRAGYVQGGPGTHLPCWQPAWTGGGQA